MSGLGLVGPQAANYRVVGPSLTVTITPKSVSVGGVTVVSREFNGGLAAEIVGTAVVVGAVSGDAVSVIGTPVGRYATAEVGVDKLVSVSGLSLGGAQAGNYVLEAVSLRGTITAQNLTLKELTLQGLTVASRVYDSTTAATVVGVPTLVGVEAGDGVSVGGVPEASFASAAAGTGKPVTVGGYTLGGADAGKYRLTQPTLTGTIEAREALVGGISAESKVADGNRGVRLNGTAVLLGILGGDAVSVTGTAVGEFADAEAGSGKPVSVSGLSLGGAQAGNYRLATPALKASIWTAVAGDRVEVAYGWGSDAKGQLGDGRSSDATSAVTVVAGARSAAARWWQISAGGGHSVALGSDGTVYAWGGNGSGQLGMERRATEAGRWWWRPGKFRLGWCCSR